MIISRARRDDLDTILTWRDEASRWLATRGIDQWAKPWPTAKEQAARIVASIDAGETWMVWDDGSPVATVALDRRADARLWTSEERLEAALYLHRLIVQRKYAGRRLGAEILTWACTKAACVGAQWVRIDVWTDNRRLQEYYEQHGFQHVRTLNLVDYPSGALYQRPAVAVPTPHLQEK
jgi:GNAT superfamily N-acetyltransferase